MDDDTELELVRVDRLVLADGRQLEPSAVEALIDTAIFQGEAALGAKLVDRLVLFEQVRDDAPWRARSSGIC